MSRVGRDEYEAAAQAQGRLLGSHGLSASSRITAYRAIRVVTPGAYAKELVDALISQTYKTRDAWESDSIFTAEAVEVARAAAETDPHDAQLLVHALDRHQRNLVGAGRRAEALEACRELAEAGRRAYEAGAAQSPSSGSWNLACRLAENGRHEDAAALFAAMVHDNKQVAGKDKDFWTVIAWIAETEAAGDHSTAREALSALIDDGRARADQEAEAYAIVIWELLLLAELDRTHGRDQQAESCDAITEELLKPLAADGEPKNWSNILAWWAVLAGLSGRTRDQPAPGKLQAPLFLDLGWSPPLISDYTGPGRERLQAEVARLAGLADREPTAYLGPLIDTQRTLTLRSVKYWGKRSWRVTDELRQYFDDGVRLARRLAEMDEEAGRPALSRALADRTGMHVAARDFPPALADFAEARRVR